MNIPKISICSYIEAERRLVNEPENYEYVISLGSPGAFGISADPLPLGFDKFSGQKLRLEFDDVSYPTPGMLKAGYQPPSRDDAKKIIDFTAEVDGPILIHCAAGISRSSASALILIAQKFGKGKEHEALHYLVTLDDKDPDIFPNELLLYYADNIMDRHGELIMAYREVFF